jgi:hypothetical protein
VWLRCSKTDCFDHGAVGERETLDLDGRSQFWSRTLDVAVDQATVLKGRLSQKDRIQVHLNRA